LHGIGSAQREAEVTLVIGEGERQGGARAHGIIGRITDYPRVTGGQLHGSTTTCEP
jgi:hypothetical protein